MLMSTADILRGIVVTLLKGLCDEQGTDNGKNEHLDLVEVLGCSQRDLRGARF